MFALNLISSAVLTQTCSHPVLLNFSLPYAYVRVASALLIVKLFALCSIASCCFAAANSWWLPANLIALPNLSAVVGFGGDNYSLQKKFTVKARMSAKMQHPTEHIDTCTLY